MSERTDAYLFRHGEALNNVQEHIVGGRSNESRLVKNGIIQAIRLGLKLRDKGLIPDIVYSSSAKRAKQTGEAALLAMGLELDIIEDDRLHEQETGDWTGQLAVEIFTDETVRTIEASGKNFRSPNGESMNDVGNRMFEWAESLAVGTADTPHVVFAFTHGGAIRCFASRILNWSHAQTYEIRPANASISVFRKIDGLWSIDALGIDAEELDVSK